jgi:hypothetical protein
MLHQRARVEADPSLWREFVDDVQELLEEKELLSIGANSGADNHAAVVFARASQCLKHPQAIFGRPLHHLRDWCDELEAMLCAWVHVELNRNAGLAQFERIGDVFVAEDVQLSDFDVRGREVVQIGGSCRRRTVRHVVFATAGTQ